MTFIPKPHDWAYRFVVRTGLFGAWLLRLRMQFTGRENLPQPGPMRRSGLGFSRKPVPGQGAIIAITHFGYLDFAVAEYMLWKHSRAQMRFMITKGATKHWLAGPAIHATGHVIVDRSDGRDAYAGAMEKLRDGEYLAILPEAGVSRSFTVRALKTGAVRLAQETGLPIIPISVWGGHRLMTRGHGFSWRRAWWAPIRAHVSEPIFVGPDADVRAETERLREELQSGIDSAASTFPLEEREGDWWVPASRGGSAMSVSEQKRLDAAEDPVARGR